MDPYVGYGQWQGGAAPGVAPGVPFYPHAAPQPPVDFTGPPKSGGLSKTNQKKRAQKMSQPFALNPAISTKNQLQEYAQYHGLPFPVYTTRPAPNGENTGWISTVLFNEVEYTDESAIGSKKQAEARAAEACLRAVGMVASPKPVPSIPTATPAPQAPAAEPADVKPKSTGKSDLHYFLTSRKIPPAVYSTKEADGEVKGFVSTVEAAGDIWECLDVMPNKKAAENRAAEMALEVLKSAPEEEKEAPPPPPENLVLTALNKELMFKTYLNDYCTKRQLANPQYQSETVVGTNCRGHKATCEALGTVFHSEEGKLFPTKKQAEQAAANAAWDTVKERVAAEEAAGKSVQSVPYKTILQEHLGRRDLEQPAFTYEKVEGSGFLAICAFEGQSHKSTTPYFNKKTAEMEAAKIALEGLGIVNLEKIVERRILKAKRLIGTGFNWRDTIMKFFEAKGKKMPEIIVEPKNGRYFAHLLIEGKKYASDKDAQISNHERVPGFQEEESAIQSASKNACVALSIPLHVPAPGANANGQAQAAPPPTMDVVMDDATGQDVHVPTPSLKRRLDEWVGGRSVGRGGTKKFRAEEAWAVPKHLLKSLVVVEVWPDKKNVVIVGNEFFSCPMLCLNDESKCEIEVDGKNVTLEPGMVLEDVEAVFKFIFYCGGIALLANQCGRVSMATASTSPVVTGAGVVVLTREDDVVKVLLKRYKTSMAFIPVAQELSFVLRRAGDVWNDFPKRKKSAAQTELAKQPVELERVGEKIHLWTNEEVDAVRLMTPESMKALFSVTKWKWLERWDAILQRKTKTELREILKKKQEEEKEKIAAGKPVSTADEDTKGSNENPPYAVINAGKMPPLPLMPPLPEMPPLEIENAGSMEEEGDHPAEDGDKQNGMDVKPNVVESANGSADVKEEEDNVPLLTKYGLDDVAKMAEAEFQRRQSLNDGSLDELLLRPWGFPKGGFRHQALSTGIHLESAAECARRELREECGIVLKLPDVEKAEKVVVLRTDADNMNPHKGDASLYFLHEVDPSVSKNAGKPIQDLMDITRNYSFPFHFKSSLQRRKHHPPIFKQPQLLRQKEVHEEFTWFPLEEAAALTPVFKYIMTTDDFRDFAKLPPIVIEEKIPKPSSPARAANTASPARPGGRRGRR